MPAFGKRRALGQHFLRDQNIARLIASTAVQEAARTGAKALLEVGPGKGAITHLILEEMSRTPNSPATLTLAERDRDLVANWKNIASTHAVQNEVSASLKTSMNQIKLIVEEGDFLDLPEDRWLTQTPLAVASNLPYSAGTAILTRLAHHPDKIPVMVLMFQAEVAARLRAEPDTKAWGSLSIWIQNQWDVRKLIAAPPGAFQPPPDVHSEVVVLTRRETPRVNVTPEQNDAWEALLKACFAHRRKMLRSGLPAGSPYKAALEASGIEPTLRAEALTWDDWAKLFKAFTGLNQKDAAILLAQLGGSDPNANVAPRKRHT